MEQLEALTGRDPDPWGDPQIVITCRRCERTFRYAVDEVPPACQRCTRFLARRAIADRAQAAQTSNSGDV